MKFKEFAENFIAGFVVGLVIFMVVLVTIYAMSELIVSCGPTKTVDTTSVVKIPGDLIVDE